MLDGVSTLITLGIVLVVILSIILSIAYAIWRIENSRAIYYLKWMNKNGIEVIRWATIDNEDGSNYRYPKEVLIKTPKGECILKSIGSLTRSSPIMFEVRRKIIRVDGHTHVIESALEDVHIGQESISHDIFSKKINKYLEDIISMENL